MKRFLLPALLTVSLILSACSAASSSDQTPPQSFDPAPQENTGTSQDKSSPVSPTLSGEAATESDSSSNALVSVIDSQGAVTVEATPLNLDSPTEDLEFDVVLNTHSVDLSMDLATLATLTTDTGITVQATTWDAPRGGHHVEGKLIFLATKDDKPILEGATKLTLTIVDVDAPSRVFEWELQ
jgi:hypothetical protein